MFFEEDNKEDGEVSASSIEAAFEDGEVEVEIFEETNIFFAREEEDEEDDELDIAFHHDDPRDWY
jgi:hypothetical protein